LLANTASNLAPKKLAFFFSWALVKPQSLPELHAKRLVEILMEIS